MRPIEDILEEYNTVRETFHNYTSVGEIKKESLNVLQEKFVSLKADLTEWKAKFTNNWTRHDDKSATAIKYRIAVAISRGEFTDKGDTEPMPKTTLSMAEKLAAGCKTYKEFIDQRAFNKETLNNISDIREDCNSYITLIINITKGL